MHKQNQRQRQKTIVDLVRERGFVTTETLVQHFNVTPQTIRRDLNDLAEANLVSRHHGGAASPSSTENTDYATRLNQFRSEKKKIADSLVRHIPDGSSLFINIGTSTESVARALLVRNNLRVVTNNLHAAAILTENSSFTVILAGGEVRNRDGGIIGEATRDFIHQFSMDYAIIGISGVGMDGALIDFDYHEVRVAQAMVNNATHVFLAADHSKFGRQAMVRLGDISMLDALFTDKPPPEELIRLLEQKQVQLVLPDMDAPQFLAE
ncbi:DeoR/GlpR family transcriptional regulator [Pelagibaculum spongiae]|uniref:DeoR/GlpR family transcriptional regulator n=1 Tax=Pelagibaculum spongiae TaxID=2080658 RepID=A0A2V1H2P0_9GAMM|nr:DeoR/GlpR family transcriptional regulator [Pelagibaculum spongiae]PVZ70279.1 DeoR/GlpR family transcriptional regulator [Pelagibaculum spongiae]